MRTADSRPASLRKLGSTLQAEDKTMSNLPHGIRLNNPGNLRRAVMPAGALGIIDGFQAFDTMETGLANLFVLSMNYYTKLGLRTVPTFIARYAPASENDLMQYEQLMCRFCNINPLKAGTQDINLIDEWCLIAWCRGIIRVENGRPGANWPTMMEWFTVAELAAALKRAQEWKSEQSV